MISLKQLLADIRSCNIRVLLNKDIEAHDGKARPAAILDENGYAICIPTAQSNISDEAMIQLLLHEAAHIWRGDLLTMRAERETLDMLRANVAMDCIINKAIDTQLLFKEIGYEGVTIENTHAKFPAVPLNALGWRQVYNAIPPTPLDPNWQPQDLLKWDDSLSDEEALMKHLITVQKMGKCESLKPGNARPVVKPASAPYDPRINDLLKLTNYTESLRGASLRIHARSWSRPGRLPYLRGQTRLWRKHVMLALDMSGSMQEHHQLLLAAARAVARTTRLTLLLYSDDILWCGPAETLPSDLPCIGGGTAIQPVLRRAAQLGPDLLIIATDAEHEHITASHMPPCPVLWALTADSGNAPVRRYDRTIPIFRGGE